LTVSIPGMVGSAGREPVAMTKRRAWMVCSPALSVLASANSACAFRTLTPLASSRSADEAGATLAMT
jgi:hypothetical protein